MAASKHSDASARAEGMMAPKSGPPPHQLLKGIGGLAQMPEEIEFDFGSEKDGPAYRDNRHDSAILANNKRTELFQGKTFPSRMGGNFAARARTKQRRSPPWWRASTPIAP